MKRSEMIELLQKQNQEFGDGDIAINTRNINGARTTIFQNINNINISKREDKITIIDLD